MSPLGSRLPDAADLPVLMLLWFGLCFGLQHKVGPMVLRAVGLPERHWPPGLPGQPVPACLRGRAGAVRRCLRALFTCAYCVGFHAGVLTWALAGIAPAWALHGLMAASACYLLSAAADALEGRR